MQKRDEKPKYEPLWNLYLLDFLSDEHEADPWKKLTSKDKSAMVKAYLNNLIEEAEYTLIWFGFEKTKWKTVRTLVTAIGAAFNSDPREVKKPFRVKKSYDSLKIIPFEVASIASAAQFILDHPKHPHINLVWLALGQLQERLIAATEYPRLFNSKQRRNASSKMTATKLLKPILVARKAEGITGKALVPWFMEMTGKDIGSGVFVIEATSDQLKIRKGSDSRQISVFGLLNLYSTIKQ